MEIVITKQLILFLWSVVLGVALSLIYSFFRVVRKYLPKYKAVIFLSDLVFWLLTALVNFIFFMSTNSGVLRGYIILGELCGFILCYFTLGRLLYAVVTRVVSFVIKIIMTILGFIFRPVLAVLGFIRKIIQKSFNYFLKFIKKVCKKLQYRLKRINVLLYNILKNAKRRKETEAE